MVVHSPCPVGVPRRHDNRVTTSSAVFGIFAKISYALGAKIVVTCSRMA
jgi:hypothetical protein